MERETSGSRGWRIPRSQPRRRASRKRAEKTERKVLLARFSVGATPLQLDLFSTYSCILLTVEQKSTCTGIGNRYRRSFVIYGLFAQKCEYYNNFNQLQNYLCIIRICSVSVGLSGTKICNERWQSLFETLHCHIFVESFKIAACNFCLKQFFVLFMLFSDDITLVIVRWNFNDACFHCLHIHFCPVFQPIVRLLANTLLLIPRVSTETIVSITKVSAPHSTGTLYASTTISSKNREYTCTLF